MFGCDFLCRVAAYPKFVNSDVFDPEQFFSFQSVGDKKNVYVSSVASYYLLRDDSGVHDYGEAYVSSVNERAEKARLEGGRPKAVTAYLGFYKLTYQDIISVIMDYYLVEVKWRPENGRQEHFQIEFVELKNAATRSQKRNQRTDAISQLFSKAKGPVLSPVVGTQDQIAEWASLLPVKD